jgi:hypothetical protein
MFANKISVAEYAKQATPIMDRMIKESQAILPISGSKV